MPKRKADSNDMLKGTLDTMVLRTLVHGEAHGHTIAKIIERSDDVLQSYLGDDQRAGRNRRAAAASGDRHAFGRF